MSDNYHNYTQKALRRTAKQRGISYSNKKKEQLIEELRALDSDREGSGEQVAETTSHMRLAKWGVVLTAVGLAVALLTLFLKDEQDEEDTYMASQVAHDVTGNVTFNNFGVPQEDYAAQVAKYQNFRQRTECTSTFVFSVDEILSRHGLSDSQKLRKIEAIFEAGEPFIKELEGREIDHPHADQFKRRAFQILAKDSGNPVRAQEFIDNLQSVYVGLTPEQKNEINARRRSLIGKLLRERSNLIEGNPDGFIPEPTRCHVEFSLRNLSVRENSVGMIVLGEALSILANDDHQALIDFGYEADQEFRTELCDKVIQVLEDRWKISTRGAQVSSKPWPPWDQARRVFSQADLEKSHPIVWEFLIRLRVQRIRLGSPPASD